MAENPELAGQRPLPRFKARFAVYYGTEQQKLMTDYAVNISTGGIFLETNRILPVDTPLFVEFMLPGSDTPIECNARVSWTNGPTELKKPLLPAGMGLQFLDLTLEELHMIRDFLGRGDLQPTW